MILFPAIDLYEGRAVRLTKGDYNRMTVYADDPVSVALDFRAQGAEAIHIVDLEGARDGKTPNLKTVLRIREASGLFCEIGGGIRSTETLKTYMDAGLDRAILGTAALTDPAFLSVALAAYGDRIAVGVDLKDGRPAVRGWLETAETDADAFFSELVGMGVSAAIVTDISRDGMLGGANLPLYRALTARYPMRFTASGGVTTLEDIKTLRDAGLYGAIVGRAYYTGALSLREAIEVAK